MTQPTDAEYEVARLALYPELADLAEHRRSQIVFTEGGQGMINRVAQALADQRAKYEAVAGELDEVEVALSGVSYVVERMRQVAQ